MRIRFGGAISTACAACLVACSSETIESTTIERSARLAIHGAAVAGISREALHAAVLELERRVADGDIAGGAHMVGRGGKVVHFHVVGVRDVEDRAPFTADTIVRIYSMTKPITSVAAMTLWERGEFELDDPVSKYIPSFEAASVLAKSGDSYEIVPPERPITVRDVFRHTTGYTYGRDDPALLAYHEEEGVLYDEKLGMFPPEMTIAEAAESLARIPAAHQPGATFTYGFSTDLLGRLIEVWSGQPLDAYLRKTIFDPLDMIDTGFAVPAEKHDRFGSCHRVEDGERVVVDKAGSSPFLEGFEFLSGGGGLVSTMRDYANFCEMLVRGGEYAGKRVLEPATLDLMFSDQLAGTAGDFRFGLGFAIRDVELGAGDAKRTEVAYYWGGYANTAFVVVPEADLFQIFMRQSIPSDHHVAEALFQMIYAGTY